MRPARHGIIPLLALFAGSCSGDPTITDRPAPDTSIFVGPTDAEATEGGEACPDNEPKLGDRCPPGFSEGNSCTYAVDTCVAPNGTTYVDYLTYCCLGSLWAACGGMSGCDAFDAGPPVGPKPGDGGAPDAPDASVDGAVPDAPVQDAGQSDGSPDGGAQG